MQTGLIRLITTQKVLKTWSVKGMTQHYLGINHQLKHNWFFKVLMTNVHFFMLT